VGHFYVREGSESYALIRTDSAGNELWHRRIDSVQFVKMPWGLCEEPDRGFLISADDCWFMRTDASGNTLWAHQWPEMLTPHLCPAPRGGCYVAGEWRDSTRDSWHVVTFWLDPNGGPLRAGSYRKGISASASDIAATPDGGWVVFGSVRTTVHGDTESHALVLKYSPDGELEWDHTLGSDRSKCVAGVAGADGWYTLAVQDEPPDGSKRLTIVRTKP
jgi:hypothetical protein